MTQQADFTPIVATIEATERHLLDVIQSAQAELKVLAEARTALNGGMNGVQLVAPKEETKDGEPLTDTDKCVQWFRTHLTKEPQPIVLTRVADETGVPIHTAVYAAQQMLKKKEIRKIPGTGAGNPAQYSLRGR